MKTALVEEARRAVSKETIVETIKVLSDVAAAPGTELRAAENLAALGRRRGGHCPVRGGRRPPRVL